MVARKYIVATCCRVLDTDSPITLQLGVQLDTVVRQVPHYVVVPTLSRQVYRGQPRFHVEFGAEQGAVFD